MTQVVPVQLFGLSSEVTRFISWGLSTRETERSRSPGVNQGRPLRVCTS